MGCWGTFDILKVCLSEIQEGLCASKGNVDLDLGIIPFGSGHVGKSKGNSGRDEPLDSTINQIGDIGYLRLILPFLQEHSEVVRNGPPCFGIFDSQLLGSESNSLNDGK